MALGVGLFAFMSQRTPPDSVFVEKFRTNRMIYEQLRDSLDEDEKIKEVAPWGFRTFESPLVFQPPTPVLSVARYKQYLSLLATLKASGASRSEGLHPSRVCIAMWSYGWGADTKHIAICSVLPAAAVLDGSSQTSNSGFKLKHIDGDWYLQKDS